MYFVNLPSEIAGNRLLFPDMKQQLLEFVIEGGISLNIVLKVNGDWLIQKFIYKQFENPTSLQMVIVIK